MSAAGKETNGVDKHAEERCGPAPAVYLFSSDMNNFHCNVETMNRGKRGALKKRILRTVRNEPHNEVLKASKKLKSQERGNLSFSPSGPVSVSDDEWGDKKGASVDSTGANIGNISTGVSTVAGSTPSAKELVVKATNKQCNSGGIKAFPEKLMDMLEREDFSHAIHWIPHGKAFVIPCPKIFTLEVLPLFFQRSEFSSFTRKLYYWGFRKITKGADMNAFQHELFQRGNRNLCKQMRAGRIAEGSRGKSKEVTGKERRQDKKQKREKVGMAEESSESNASSTSNGLQVDVDALLQNVVVERRMLQLQQQQFSEESKDLVASEIQRACAGETFSLNGNSTTVSIWTAQLQHHLRQQELAATAIAQRLVAQESLNLQAVLQELQRKRCLEHAFALLGNDRSNIPPASSLFPGNGCHQF